MSTNTDHETIEEALKSATQKERARCVGMVLNAYGLCKLSGQDAAARILDALATKIEQDDWPGEEG